MNPAEHWAKKAQMGQNGPIFGKLLPIQTNIFRISREISTKGIDI